MKKLVFVTIFVLAMLPSPGHLVPLPQGSSPPQFNPYQDPPGYTPPNLNQGPQGGMDPMMLTMLMMSEGGDDMMPLIMMMMMNQQGQGADNNMMLPLMMMMGRKDCPKCKKPEGCKCGTLGSQPRVIGGSVTSVKQYPWMMFVWAKDTKTNLDMKCGGTLVAAKYLVTAAHCVSGYDKILVTSGLEDVFPLLWNADGPQEALFEGVAVHIVSKIMVHENYNSDTGDNNIAVLELLLKIDTDVYPPACLAKSSDNSTFYGKEAQVHGYTELMEPSDPLQVVTVPVVSKAKCEAALGSSVDDGHLCAGGEDGKDACTGLFYLRDDGGPLTHYSNGQSILIGVVGDTGRREDCGKEGVYRKYIRVSHYRSWIESKMKDVNSYCPSGLNAKK